MSAEITGLAELGWKAEAWEADPAAIDGMIQVGLKWSEKLLGGAMLPMAFEEFQLIEPGAKARPLRATARTRHVHDSRVVCDIALAASSGKPVAWLTGVEFVLRPDLARPVAAV